MSRFLPQLAITLAMLIWSINFIWSKQVFHVYSPQAVILARLLLALGFLALVRRLWGITETVQPRHLPRFALLGFFCPFLYYLGEGYGISLTPSTLSALVVANVPVVFPLVTFLVFGERVTALGLTGLVVAGAGMALTVINPQHLQLEYSPKGLLFLAVSVVCSTLYVLLSRPLLDEYKGITVVLTHNVFAALYYLPLVVALDGRQLLHQRLEGAVWLKILYLGLGCTALAYLLYAYAIARLPLWQANAFENLIPIFTALFAYWWQGEALGARQRLGFCIVLAGIVLSQWATAPKAPVSTQSPPTGLRTSQPQV